MSSDECAGDPHDSGVFVVWGRFVFVAQNRCYFYARAEAVSLFGEADIPMVYVEQVIRLFGV